MRRKIPAVDKDRVFAEDINIGLDIINNKELVKVVNAVTEEEHIEFKNENHEVPCPLNRLFACQPDSKPDDHPLSDTAAAPGIPDSNET